MEQPGASTGVRQQHIDGMGEVYFQVQPFFLMLSEEFRSTYRFDVEGRFLSGFFEGVNYLRGLDGRILRKERSTAAGRVRRFLSDEEARVLVDDVLARVAHIRQQVGPATLAEVGPWFERIRSWDSARLAGERQRFAAVYKPVGILPPDQYLSVVLQAAEGCSWNQCTFCTFYHDRPFVIKSPAAFREHARQVKALLGRAIGLRRSLFLSDANALVIPQPRLVELLQIAHAEFPIDRPKPGYDYVLEGIYSFLDIFGAEKKGRDAYRVLAEAGVRRIYIGLETGDAALFRLLNKPGSPAECVEAVRTIKAGGIQVGVILLAGVGGVAFAEQHVARSLAVLAQMGLDSGDIVYLSPLVVSGEDAYSRTMRERGIAALSDTQVREQVQRVKAALKQGGNSDRPRVTLYHIQDFFY
jgi:hypothetical protein